MDPRYIMSEEHLPDDFDDEVTLQVTDAESKKIFTTRAQIAEDPSQLPDPEPLTILRGPHENIEDQWYIQIIETDPETVETDRELMRECIAESREEDLVNTRSEEVRAMVTYLVETGEYQSVSDAIRSLVMDELADQYPQHLDAYVEIRSEFDREELEETLQRRDD